MVLLADGAYFGTIALTSVKLRGSNWYNQLIAMKACYATKAGWSKLALLTKKEKFGQKFCQFFFC